MGDDGEGMKCRECALFSGKVLPNGDYICNLCAGAIILPCEADSDKCKYTIETITDEYASRKFWLDPIDYFGTKMDEIEELLKFADSITNTNNRISERLISVLYSQLVTALEVFLYEKFKQGMQCEKAFDNFVKDYHWAQKYTPNEIHHSIEEIVNKEIDKLSFQNFEICGIAYRVAFGIDILTFPADIKKNITRVLRYRHALVHEDEVWDNESFIKISSKLLHADIGIVKEYVNLINKAFIDNIGRASEIKMLRIKTDHLEENEIDTCEKCPLGVRYNEETITCFEGAYDGLGFGIEKAYWTEPICGRLTFREAMEQRKILGEHARFGEIHLIPQKTKDR
jgi:hypothetical protein